MKSKDELNNLRQMTDADLAEELGTLKRRLFDLRAQAVTEKLEDPRLIAKTRKTIARIRTLQTQRRTATAEA